MAKFSAIANCGDQNGKWRGMLPHVKKQPLGCNVPPRPALYIIWLSFVFCILGVWWKETLYEHLFA